MENNIFGGMFGKLAPGMCRLSMDGGIAVKTSTGYRSYNTENGRLINCSSFVLEAGEDFFFLVPAKKVNKGDIILASGKPKCVIGRNGETITAINYENAVIENIIPERHILMGDTYFFGKIVSVFGNGSVKGKKGIGKIMKYMMLSEMLKGTGGNNAHGMNPLVLMAFSGGGDNMFEGIFNFDDEEGEDE